MINNEQKIIDNQEVFSTKLVPQNQKRTLKEWFVDFDNSVWEKGQNANFLGIEGVKVLPSQEWTEGTSEFFTINFLKNIGSTIVDLVKRDEIEIKSSIEDEKGYVVEFSEAPMLETEEASNFNNQFDAAPEKFDPFIK